MESMIDEKLIQSDGIVKRIYTIRNCQVMLDKDLAVLYGVKSRRLREQVKRNINRFPADFMFQLNNKEVNMMVSQNAIPSRKTLGGSLPYVFTEEGVASLSGVLTSNKAIEIHIQIMRAFVKMRQFIQKDTVLLQKIHAVETTQQVFQLETDQKFKQVFDPLENCTDLPKQGIFFDGQIFDAYCFVSDLIRSAKQSIMLIDNYIDDTVLTLLSKCSKKATIEIYTKTLTKQLALDLEKHNAQYKAIKIRKLSEAHDRFLILDNEKVYHIGASLKDLGKKWFAFSKIEKDALRIFERLSNR